MAGGDRLRLGGDADLLDAVVRGDSAAFGRLYVRHARIVFAFCGRRSADWTAAEDLCSVTFLQAWANRDLAVLVQGSLRPWLLRIAAGVAASPRRSRRRHRLALSRFVGVQEAQILGLEDDATRPDRARSRTRNRSERRARTALSRLPRPHRRVVELCLMAELTTVETAELLGIPLETVRARLGDGRARLRRRLAKDADQPAWLTSPQEGERRIGGTPVEALQPQVR